MAAVLVEQGIFLAANLAAGHIVGVPEFFTLVFEGAYGALLLQLLQINLVQAGQNIIAFGQIE